MKVYKYIKNTVSCLGLGGAIRYFVALELKKNKIPLLRGKEWKFKAMKRGFEFIIRPYEADIFLIRVLILGINMDGIGEYDISQLNEVFCGNEIQYIIDAGANIGMFSLLMANKFKNSIIVAVEPDDKNFELLKRNCNSYSNIICVHSGVWSENCILKLINPECGTMSFRFEKTNEKDGIKAIDINTLKKENNLEKIDILKIDIEGSEMEVFSKNNSWIDLIKFYIIETHEQYAPGSTEFIDKILKDKGYLYGEKGENRIYFKH